jgi:zinc and cadmium transporter
VLLPHPELVMLTAVAIGAAIAGVWLTGYPGISRRIVPFSGGLLVGISLFWALPEFSLRLGWMAGFAWIAAGFLVLLWIDRYVYPLCPTCSHTHNHDSCATRLHGFAAPLMVAATLHSIVDGWGVAASRDSGSESLGMAFLVGVGIHKVPEGLAFGVILRAALKSRSGAVLAAALAQCGTVFGGILESLIAPTHEPTALSAMLALASGSFLYLGFHAVHAEWKRRGSPAFAPALTGAAGAAVLQQGLRLLR